MYFLKGIQPILEHSCQQRGIINLKLKYGKAISFNRNLVTGHAPVSRKSHAFCQNFSQYTRWCRSDAMKRRLQPSDFLIPYSRISHSQSACARRPFHTTQSQKAIPPMLWLVLRPFASFAAVVFGRTFRKIWQKLPQEKRNKIILRLKNNRPRILGGLGAITFGLVLYILVHIEEEPHTKRKRLKLFSRQDMRNLSEAACEEILKDYLPGYILPDTHPKYRRMFEIMQRLMNANSEDIIQSGVTSWKIYVINDESVNNAMVLPNGSVLIFSGMMDTCANDDQLAAILAHEIAHVLLDHQGEKFSQEHILSLISTLLITAIWAVLPDFAALLSHLFATQTSAVFIRLPFSRLMESEADAVGLNLAAKACFDVREASVLWSKMALREELGCDEKPLQLLSTHPSHESRQKAFDELIPSALKLRELCKCPGLRSPDPRYLFSKQRDYLKEAQEKGCLSCQSLFTTFKV